ncbi:MAG: MoaD/ThiS family protein [Aggregatilineaceae bacterium]
MASPTPITDDQASDTAILIFRRLEFRARAGQTVREAIVECGLQPDDVLITRNGELIDDTTMVQPGDRIKLLPIISGG